MDRRYAYWLAALIDGEGSILIRTRASPRATRMVYISIAQNDRRLLDRAVEYMGCGAIYGGQGPLKNGHQLQVFRRADVTRILRVVAPLLIVKHDRAIEALAVLAASVRPKPRHGTHSMYTHGRCRCVRCRAAAAKYARDRRVHRLVA